MGTVNNADWNDITPYYLSLTGRVDLRFNRNQVANTIAGQKQQYTRFFLNYTETK